MGLICLPLHVWDRELDSRIVLACLLADNGHQVIFGHEHNMEPLYAYFRNIFYYGAGKPVFNKTRTYWQYNIIKNGGYVGLTFEEGLNDVQSNYYVQFAGITADGFRNITKIYSWCQTEKDLMLSQAPPALRPHLDAKTILAGSIRLELLGSLGDDYFKRRSSSISSFIGPHILISDNFGFEGWGTRKPYDMTSDLQQRITDDSYLEKVLSKRQDYLRKAETARRDFAKTVERIIKHHPSTLFILRPHPAVDPRFWHENIFPYRNLIILYKDSVEPWLFSAKTIIHAGCTVGLQAELSGKKSIDISSIYNDQRALGASSKCSSYAAKSFAELKDILSLPASKFVSFDRKKANPNDSLYSYLNSNMTSLDLNTLSRLSSINLRLPSSSALSIVYNDVNNFFSRIDSDKIPKSVISKHLLTKVPLGGKSRYYRTKEIIERIKSASDAFSLTSNFELHHFKESNVFCLSR